MTPQPATIVRARVVDHNVWSYCCARCRGSHFIEARAGMQWSVCANVQLLVLAPEPLRVQEPA